MAHPTIVHTLVEGVISHLATEVDWLDRGDMEYLLNMEHCSACGRHYLAEELSIHDHEQLCAWCEWEKYPLTDEDIPF